MQDFVNWCYNKDLIDVFDDGTVAWTEGAIRTQKCGKHTEKFAGGRDGRKDLSDDYKDYCHMMGTVWPYKVTAGSGSGKTAAPVGK